MSLLDPMKVSSLLAIFYLGKENNMIVDRRIFVAKAGKGEKMKEILTDLFESNPWPGNVRIYTHCVGPFNHVIVETESESLAAYEKDGVQFEQGFPEGLFDTWHELEMSGANEMWTLAYERRVD
jgi:hypothetical protein